MTRTAKKVKRGYITVSSEAELIKQIGSVNPTTEVDKIPIDEMKRAIKAAREALKSGSLPEIRQVINLYSKNVTVCREHIEVQLRCSLLLCLYR